MRHPSTRALIRSALVPAAVLAAVLGAPAAYAGTPAATHRPAVAGHAHAYTYTMHLSTSAATVQPGGATTTVITFEASRGLYGRPVDMSVIGLRAGATARFTPARPRVGGRTRLTITTAPGTPAGATALTVSAIIDLESSDPIGTTAPFDLTVTG
jgi:hypothetical protein